jgi:serine/threonine-protein kinase
MLDPSFDSKRFIGRELGSVSLMRELGRGANGAVFVGFQRTLQRQVAVKILPKTGMASKAASEQFRYEARLVAGLFHPNIVPIFEMGEEEDCYFQVMQIVGGEDLEKRIKNRRKHPLPHRRLLPIATIIDTISQIADGLGYAHAQQIVHQDIKPSNILIAQDSGRPMIADFGIAKARFFEQALGEEQLVIGSPLYMAPEHAANEETDHRADIYSLGMALYQMCVPQLPLAVFDPYEFVKIKVERPERLFTKRPRETSPLIDAALESVICKAIEPSRDKRYDSCAALKSALAAYASERRAVESRES